MAVNNFGSGGTHRALTGLTADDHTIYAKYDSGTIANRPAASATLDRTFYYADDTDLLSVCVDTTGAGGWAWVGVFLATGGTLTGALTAPGVTIAAAYPVLTMQDTDSATPGDLLRLIWTNGMGYVQLHRASDAIDLNYVQFPLDSPGQVRFASGSASAPALSFMADPDTGIYRVNPDNIGIAVGGFQRFQMYPDLAQFRHADNTNKDYTTADLELYRSGGTVTDQAIRMSFHLGGIRAAQFGLWPTGRFRAADGGAGFLGLDAAAFFAGGGSATAPAFAFRDDPNTGLFSDAADHIRFAIGGVSELSLRYDSLYPSADGGLLLGLSTNRWGQIYSTTSTISTSDETQKSSIEDTPLGLAFVRALRPIRFRFTDGTRPHDGFGAQQVREALDALGIPDAAAYIDPAVEADRRENPYAAKKPTAEFVADFLPEEPEDPDADAKKEHKRAVKEAKNRAQEEWDQARENFDAETEAMRAAPKGLRYSELIAPLYRAVQEQQDQIEELRAENESLQSTVSDLVARLEALENRSA